MLWKLSIHIYIYIYSLSINIWINIHLFIPKRLPSFILVMKIDALDRQASNKWTRYITEFNSGVWLCSLLFLILTSVIYSFIVKYSPSETFRPTFGEVVFSIIGAFTGQGFCFRCSAQVLRVSQKKIVASMSCF